MRTPAISKGVSLGTHLLVKRNGYLIKRDCSPARLAKRNSWVKLVEAFGFRSPIY